MGRWAKIASLGVVLLAWLVLPGACTHNRPSRALESGSGGDAGVDDGGLMPGASSDGGIPDASLGGAGGEAGAGGAGGEVDPCLNEGLPERCDDFETCDMDAVEQAYYSASVDICHFRIARCPDQPADVMMDPEPPEPIEAELGAESTATRPQLSDEEAASYTVENALAGGGVYSAEYTGWNGEGGAPTAPLGERTVSYEDGAWDPSGPIEDVNKIVPGFIVDANDPNGGNEDDGIYTTIQAAISKAVTVEGCPRVFIKVMPGVYHEKITVPAKTSTPPVTLYGVDPDPSKVVIVAHHSAAGDEDTGTPLTIHASATFTNSLPQPFQARNLTIQNDYVAGTWPGDDSQQTAVALLTQADKSLFDNVRILGHQNALYVKSTGADEVSRVYFRNCYLEGDEDMILGRGAAVLDQCEIHSLGDRVSTGSITAPSTRVDNPHGILIINSELTADDGVSDVYLGRQWYEGDTLEAVGKTIVRNSILGAHIRAEDPWAPITRVTPKDPTGTDPVVLYTSDDYYAPMTGLVPPEFYLAEFGNSGPGAAQ